MRKFKKGDRVYCEDYGYGTVVRAGFAGNAKVEFDNAKGVNGRVLLWHYRRTGELRGFENNEKKRIELISE